MKKNAYLATWRTLFMSLATIIMTLMLTMPSSGSGLVPSGNSEDATVQIACADAERIAARPLGLTFNYQNESHFVSYDRNTTDCPIEDFEGELLPGREGWGNLESVSYTASNGVTYVAERDEGEVEIQDPTPDGLIIIIIRVYHYSGSLYVEVTVISL